MLDEATKAITTWLENMGLILSPKKTRITHTLTPYEGNVGFDFLGFTVRQFPVGRTNTGKDTKGRPLGFKTIIRPSKEAIKRHMAETKQRIRKLRGAPQGKLLKELNPVIRGWATYYRTVVSARVYSECDNILYYQLVSWAKGRHPYKSMEWIMDKYWRQIEIDHIDGNHANDRLSNQMVLHRHCHDERHMKYPKGWKYAAGVDHK